MKPLSQVLSAWQPHAGAPHDPLVVLGAEWADAVGAEVARNSHPTRITGDTLTIMTRSSAWSNQLSLLAEEILTAVRARLPDVPLQRLRFRVGTIRTPGVAPGRCEPGRGAGTVVRQPASSAHEAIARFRDDVAATRRAKVAAGWKECRGCAALVSPGEATLCVVCDNLRVQLRADDVERLLFEAPWLGYAGTAALINGLSVEEYESIRSRLLARWWETLSKAKTAKRLSADRRERSIASSYVVLRSKLPPEEIAPATVRNVLGDELHDLIYGMERNETNVE